MFPILSICFSVISLPCLLMAAQEEDSVRYPTIVWHPMNPLFAFWENVTINVRINDLISLQCPTEEFNFYTLRSTFQAIYYENLFFLGTDAHRYHTCNATGTRKLLDCRNGFNTNYPLYFVDVESTEGQLVVTKGETYYLIGTGFRSEDHLNDTVGGSCSKTDEHGKYKLKLKIYVCKDDDVCPTCKSASCYYKDWGWEKTLWKTVTYNDQGCNILRIWNCTNEILGQKKQEMDFVECPTTPPFTTTTTKTIESTSGTGATKYTKTATPNTTPSTTPNTAPSTTSSTTPTRSTRTPTRTPKADKLVKFVDNSHNVAIAAVGSGLVFLTLGLVIGVCWTRIFGHSKGFFIRYIYTKKINDRTVSTATVMTEDHSQWGSTSSSMGKTLPCPP